MSRYWGALAVLVFMMGIFASSCKKGATIGAVGIPFDGEQPVFDTLLPPTSPYYFYGKFDGKFLMWQDQLRSKWDTATRVADPDNPDAPWEDWDPYKDNIYFNFCSEMV